MEVEFYLHGMMVKHNQKFHKRTNGMLPWDGGVTVKDLFLSFSVLI